MNSSALNILSRDIAMPKWLINMLTVMTGVVLLTLGAYVRIPLGYTPVPVTLQTFFVLYLSARFPGKLGFYAVCSYIGIGIAGAPVFQGYGSGFIQMLGPTGGYLLGFMAASYFISSMADKYSSKVSAFFVFLLAEVIIYGAGVAHLAVMFRMSLAGAVILGCIPFIPGEIVKLFSAFLLYRKNANRI